MNDLVLPLLVQGLNPDKRTLLIAMDATCQPACHQARPPPPTADRVGFDNCTSRTYGETSAAVIQQSALKCRAG